MLVFIDESGDAGFKINKGSTTVFVVALVIFDDELVAEEVSLRIKKLRRELNKSDIFEFKFNKLSKKLRIQFLREINNYDFRIRAIVFKKETIYSNKLREDKNSFYSYALKMGLKHSNNSIGSCPVKLRFSY